MNIQNQITLKDLDDKTAFMAISPFLEGLPLVMYQHFIKKEGVKVSYRKFIEMLDEEYNLVENKKVLLDKLIKLKVSECGSLDNYNYEFKKLVIETESINAEDLINKYANGLDINNSTLNKILKINKPKQGINNQISQNNNNNYHNNNSFSRNNNNNNNNNYNNNSYNNNNNSNYNNNNNYNKNNTYNNNNSSYNNRNNNRANNYYNNNNAEEKPKKQCEKCGRHNHYTNQCGAQGRSNLKNMNNMEMEQPSAPPATLNSLAQKCSCATTKKMTKATSTQEPK